MKPTPRPIRSDHAIGPFIQYGEVAFVLPEGWLIHRPTILSWGLSSTVLYLSNQPMQDECDITYEAESTVWRCGRPLKSMEPHSILVEWSQSYFFDPGLPPGERISLHGRMGSRSAFDSSLCADIGADGGFTVTMESGGDYYRNSFSICTRSPTALGAEQLEGFVKSITFIERPDEEPDLTGTLQGDPKLGGGCAWLRDQDGVSWDVIWSDHYHIGFRHGSVVLLSQSGQQVAKKGDVIGIQGSESDGLGSSQCRSGRSFVMTNVWSVDDPNDPNN